MATVEELREHVRGDLLGDVDALISAARAEGVGQGLRMAQRWIDSELIQGRHVISLPNDALRDAILAPKAK